jgi:hypothetical protein
MDNFPLPFTYCLSKEGVNGPDYRMSNNRRLVNTTSEKMWSVGRSNCCWASPARSSGTRDLIFSVSQPLKGCGRKCSWLNFRHYPRICLQGLRKGTKTSAKVGGLQAKTWSRDLQNTKRKYHPPDHDVQWVHTQEHICLIDNMASVGERYIRYKGNLRETEVKDS